MIVEEVARLALPVIGDALAAPLLDVPVDAVVGDVELPAEIPPRVGQLPFVELCERLRPGNPLAALGLPELLEVALVDLGLRVRVSGELGGRRIPPVLDEMGLDRLGVAHSSRSYGNSVSTSAPSAVTSTRSSSRTPP